MMRPAMIPESMLEERCRLGHDGFDEVWEGVLHMVPPPLLPHQLLESALENALQRSVASRNLRGATLRIQAGNDVHVIDMRQTL